MKKFHLVIPIGIVSVALGWLSLLAGWWWFTPVIGLLIGLFLRPAVLSFLVSIGVGGLTWSLPLAILAMNAPVTGIANAVESVIGFSSTGGVLMIALTIALGCVLSGVGMWVGVASRNLVPTHSRAS